MLFADLREQDRFDAFSGWCTVEEAIDIGFIPQTHVEYFPKVCGNGDRTKGCGSEMIVTSSLSRIRCCNPRCWVKNYKLLNDLVKNFGITGVGPRLCEDIVWFGLQHSANNSHIEMLTLEDRQINPSVTGAAYENWTSAVHRIRNTTLTFATMVSKLSIPSFDANALKAFDSIHGIEHLLDEIALAGGIRKYLAKFGIHDPMKSFILDLYLIDIAWAQYKVFHKLWRPGLEKIEVCMTGNIRLYGSSITKERFISYCNEMSLLPNGVRLFDVVMNGAISTNDFVIASKASTNPKYLKALEREHYEGLHGEPRKILYTPEEFIDYLKELIACVTENLQLQESSQQEVTEETAGSLDQMEVFPQ